MPTEYEALFFGVIQVLTEWLPISSSGHLALFQIFLGVGSDISFDIMLHIGTLLAVVAFYRSDLFSLFKGVLARDGSQIKLGLFLLASALPTAVIGFAFKAYFESMFSSTTAIGGAMLITGAALLYASRFNGTGKISLASAFLVGIAQGVAVAPGISRSGMTISTAIAFGIQKEEAVRFSFLVGIIPLIGAVVLEGRNAVLITLEPFSVLLGLATSFLVGYASIGFLLRVLRNSKLHYFGYYSIAMAFALLVFIK